MGKKVKKKPRSGQKEKPVSSTSPKTVSQKSTPGNVAATDDKAIVVRDRKICSHLHKGVNLDKLSAKLKSPGPHKCEDCREVVVDRRTSKGKGNQGKKKGGGAESRSEFKAIWVCLECGHFSCGGVGLPNKPQTHAIRHAKQYHHPLALQFENPQLRWCFQCSTLVPAEKSEDGTEQHDVLHDIVKMIKVRPSEGPALDAEEVGFGKGSILSGIKSENPAAVGTDGKGSYSVRGLVNLGNTCFFNSVMQNLLALDRLRNYFLKVDGSFGPLTAALKKLVGETVPESGLRNSINTRSLFGSVCAKAPQFKGYQQQDSHELLRCLLDGLSTEEMSTRKQIESSREVEDKNSDPTFVDALFGGQLSSTVTCLECGHSSIVHEPFLDLSLPVPTKRPPSTKAQPATGAKKPKPPPRRNGRNRPKLDRVTNTLPSQSSLEKPISGKSPSQVQSGIPVQEPKVVSSGNCALLCSSDASVMDDEMCLTSHNSSTAQHAGTNQDNMNVTEKPALEEEFTWLDYLEEDIVSNDNTVASQINDLSVNQGDADEDAVQNEVPLQNSLECSSKNMSSCMDTASYSDNVTCTDYCGEEKLSDAQDLDSEINENLVYQDSAIMNTKTDVRLDNSSESCCKTCSRDLNLGFNSLGNFSEEETCLLVQDSSVILLPYKEDALPTDTVFKTEGEASSSAVGYEQDSLDFDGFGGLFDEPEAARSSSMKPSSVDNSSEPNAVVGAGFIGNSSESEPDEVDNTDAPVSVESCSAYFTKSELLSKNEHGWQCENCSRVFREERRRLRKKLWNSSSENLINGAEDRDTFGLLCLYKNHPLPSEVRHLGNGNVKMETLNISDDSCMKHDEKVNGNGDCALECGQQVQLKPVASQAADQKVELQVAPVDLAQSSAADKNCCQLDNIHDKCNADEPSVSRCPDGNIQEGELHKLTAGGGSEASEDEKTNSEIVKVERDATKRILINKAPPILIIHLKRFSQDARGRLSKLNGHVVFNLTIDLKPYLDPRCMDRDEYKYSLVGVVEHLGTMRGGHYVAYVRGGTKSMEKAENESGDYIWYHASDAYVREASLEEVLRSEAYILFYERI